MGKEGGRDTLVYALWISLGPGLTLSRRKRASGVQQAGMTFRSPPWHLKTVSEEVVAIAQESHASDGEMLSVIGFTMLEMDLSRVLGGGCLKKMTTQSQAFWSHSQSRQRCAVSRPDWTKAQPHILSQMNNLELRSR